MLIETIHRHRVPSTVTYCNPGLKFGLIELPAVFRVNSVIGEWELAERGRRWPIVN